MANRLLTLHNRVARLEQRMSGMLRHAPVHEVNAAEGWVRLDLGEGDSGPLISPRIPYGQFAGALKVHTPPSVGQNMTVVAPAGDMRQAVAIPLTWSNQNESPSDSQDENVLTFGDVRITVNEGETRFEIGGLTMSITGEHVRVDVGGFAFRVSGGGLAMAGGAVGHDGQNIGSTHRHPGIMPGPADTGTPIDGAPSP